MSETSALCQKTKIQHMNLSGGADTSTCLHFIQEVEQ